MSGEQKAEVSTERLLEVIQIPLEFRRDVANVVGPATTMVVTQPAASRATTTSAEAGSTVLTSEERPADPPAE